MGHDLDESFLYTCRDFYFEKTISMVYILPLNHKYFFVGAQNILSKYQKQKGSGTSQQSLFRSRNEFRKIPLFFIYYLTKFDNVM